MIAIGSIQNSNNLDVRWPSQVLLDAIGFQSRVRGGVEDFRSIKVLGQGFDKELVNDEILAMFF